MTKCWASPWIGTSGRSGSSNVTAGDPFRCKRFFLHRSGFGHFVYAYCIDPGTTCQDRSGVCGNDTKKRMPLLLGHSQLFLRFLFRFLSLCTASCQRCQQLRQAASSSFAWTDLFPVRIISASAIYRHVHFGSPLQLYFSKMRSTT